MITLTDTELRNLTGYKLRQRQADWLRAQGIPYRADSNGRIIVTSEHVAQWVSGKDVRPANGPRMDLVA